MPLPRRRALDAFPVELKGEHYFVLRDTEGLLVVVASIFFVIPGLIAAFFLMFALPAVLLDGAGALDALGRSARLVRANLGPALGLVIGVIIVMVALWIAIALLTNVPLLGQLASALLLGVFAAYVAVVAVRVYRLLPVR